MEEVSIEVYDIAKALYNDDNCDILVGRDGRVENTDVLTDYEDFNGYEMDCSEADYNKAVEYLKSLLSNVKFYTDHNRYLELNDNHTLYNIEVPEGKQLDLETYQAIVDLGLQSLEEKINTSVYALGRSGRHICIDDTFNNLVNYSQYQTEQKECEAWVIQQVEKEFNNEENELSLHKGEYVDTCLNCGETVIYTDKDIFTDIDGSYVQCPNCGASFDVDVQPTEKEEAKSEKSNYEKGLEYLENIAKEEGAKEYEIVEDTYEYPNGLMLIIYSDAEHENEVDHICIDLDNLDEVLKEDCSQASGIAGKVTLFGSKDNIQEDKKENKQTEGVTTPSGKYDINEYNKICDKLKQAYKDAWANKISYAELENIKRQSGLSNAELQSIQYNASREEDKKEESSKLTETSDNELEKQKQDLRARERQALKDIGDPDPDNLIGRAKRLPAEKWNEFKKEEDRLSAIEMIHSILIYTDSKLWTEKYVMEDKYMQDYINDLGEDTVRDIVNKEIADFKENATVQKDVYTDSEGVSYNSLDWKKKTEDINLTEAIKHFETTKRLPVEKTLNDLLSKKGIDTNEYRICVSSESDDYAEYGATEYRVDLCKADDMYNGEPISFTTEKELISTMLREPKDYEQVIKWLEQIYTDIENGKFDKYKTKTEEALDNKLQEEETSQTISEKLNTGVLPIVDTDMYSLNDVLPENATQEELDNIVKEIATPYIKENIQKVFKTAEVNPIGVYHPKQYNYSGDELEFNLNVSSQEFDTLKEKVLSDTQFANFIKEAYSSSSGFISTMPTTLDEFETADVWQQLVQIIMFELKDEELTDVNEAYLNDFLDAVNNEFPTEEEIDESKACLGLSEKELQEKLSK